MCFFITTALDTQIHKKVYLLWKFMNHKPSKKRLQNEDIVKMALKYLLDNS